MKVERVRVVNWNVREIRRQIKTNLYVRAGISKKTEFL